MATFKKWNEQRTSLLRQFMAAGYEIESLYKIGQSALQDPARIYNFVGRFPTLDRFYSKFEDYTEQLFQLNDVASEIDATSLKSTELLSEFPDAPQKKLIADIRSCFMACQEWHIKFSTAKPAGADSHTDCSRLNITESANNSFQLPKIPLPRFDGNYEQWISFRDVFTSLVHKHPTLSGTQKFHHLIGALIGDAKGVVSGFPLTDKDYPNAWAALNAAYDNPRLLASVYVNKLLKSAPMDTKVTPDALRKYLIEVSDTVTAFKGLKIPNEADFLLFTLAARNLPASLRQEFQLKLKDGEFPSTTQLSDYVRSRQLAMQLADPERALSTVVEGSTPARNKPIKPFKSGKVSLMTSQASGGPDSEKPKISCPICKHPHGLLGCTPFNNMTPSARFDSLKGWDGCKACLSFKHKTSECSNKNAFCRLCKLKHNTLLCLGSGRAKKNPSNGEQPVRPSLCSTLNTKPAAQEPVAHESQIILGTIRIDFIDARGAIQTLRAVLDSGSQFSYLTHKAVSRLGFQVHKTPRKISTLGGALFEASQGVVQAAIHGRNKIPNLSTEFVVVKTITSALPTFPISESVRKKFSPYSLADPNFHKVAPVDVLLGCDIFPEIVSGQMQSIGVNLPYLLPTIYGEVVMGKLTEAPPKLLSGTSLFSASLAEDNLNFDLQRFWEVEEIPSADSTLPLVSADDELAESIFREGSYRLADGRFGVRLPFYASTPPDLSGSKAVAKKRFLNLESKFRRNPELKTAYIRFMDEYASLNHMEHAQGGSLYVIPHHAVFNKQKIRVVFDGSSGGPNSLNSHLLPGPPLQNDLRNVLLEFRTFAVAFTTDVVKMFRQIEIHPSDRKYQTVFWRADESLPLETYELKTVTYGLCSSPYHALRCMKELETETRNEFPLASRALTHQVYVDDFLCGGQDVPTALQAQRELISVMRQGGFELAKWASNSPEILAAVAPQPDEVQSVEFSPSDIPDTTKVLGLKWDVIEDAFKFSVVHQNDPVPTKRKILSTVARMFDPLGLISPVTVSFKIIIQQLWLAKLGWDAPTPDYIKATWSRLTQNLAVLSRLKVPRHITGVGQCTYQLIGFADASEQAMCCVLYLRSVAENQTSVQLLTAKTRVAPLKAKLTIPRLELSAAVMMAKLYHATQAFREALPGPCSPPVFFTDSMVALAWITRTKPSHLKVFVANRVSEIQNLTPAHHWRHVSGSLNPSDLGSRGVLPQDLVDNQFWFSGPSFLIEPEESWPSTPVDDSIEIPEFKTKVLDSSITLLSFNNTASLVDWMNRFSDYRTLLRVTARILRVIYNRRNKSKPRNGEFLLVEITEAFTACVRATQDYHFFRGNPANFPKIQREYRSLSPWLDPQGIIRVGGRLEHAPIDYSHRHPVLLPTKSKLTVLLVEYYHRACMHPSPSLLHALIQRRVWIPQVRRLVRTVTRKCVTCFSSRASAVIPMMGNLPSYRLTAVRAFAHVGLDFAGPFSHKTSLLRKAVVSKMYFCVFVCMTTKAVHLEAVTDLSTKAFLAAFSRFTSRRGKPTHVYSDNGSNFLGASRELKELYQWFHNPGTQNDISRSTINQDIDWSFTPPYSPHFGGVWEAAVRSTKHFIRAAVGETALTFEEFSTLLAQTEALLNSRPLCPLSDSPEDLDYLSPGHFLIGSPLLAAPEKSILEQRINNLQRWQIVKLAYQKVWSRFHTEYLSTLQKRTKWTAERPGLQVGDLVLIKLPDTRPLCWPTARVIETHPGTDERTRVVTIRTQAGVYKRSSANLIPLLPINESTRDEEDVIPAP